METIRHIDITFSSRYPHMKKSGGVKSGNRGGHGTSLKREIKRPQEKQLLLYVVSPHLVGTTNSHIQIFQLWQ